MTYNIQERLAPDNTKPSGLEMVAGAFDGQSSITVAHEQPAYVLDGQQAGVICVFYICGLPFVRC